MKTAADLYPSYVEEEKTNKGFYGPSDYQPMIDEIGKVLIQVDDSDYQGDSRVLYEKDGKYGYLIFGWGSCSGCDALQGCSTIAEIQDVLDSMVNDIKWFDSLSVLQEYFKSKDWGLEYAWHAQETKRFVSEVINYNN